MVKIGTNQPIENTVNIKMLDEVSGNNAFFLQIAEERHSGKIASDMKTRTKSVIHSRRLQWI